MSSSTLIILVFSLAAPVFASPCLGGWFAPNPTASSIFVPASKRYA
ncbi:hypothetical protein ABW636_03135 [Aquimarina sp. 2201CG1-2-11]